MRHLALPLFVSVLLGTASAAQPLAALAPAETFAVLGFRTGDAAAGVGQALADDLGALDWARARRTLERLGAFSDDPTASGLLGLYGQMFQGGQEGRPQGAGGSRFGRCLQRQLASVAWPDEGTPANEGGLITASASPYNPVPAVTATLRATPAAEPAYTAVQRALVRCTERAGSEVRRLQEGGTPMFVLGNAGDFPVVVSRRGRLFVAGTNPEVVRAVLRRAGGSSEASLAETPLYQNNQELLERPGLSLALDAAALAGTVESVSSGMTDAQSAPLVDRATAALRTLGTYAGTLGLDRAGVRLESQLTVNPEGGDPELAALLLNRTPAPEPRFAPRSSYSVSTTSLPVGPLFRYLDGWTRLVTGADGQPLGLRGLARQAGLDLDVALLGWLGDTWESAVLEPVGTDLTPYIYGQGQIYAVETSGEAATRAGLAEWGRFFRQLADQEDLGEFDSTFLEGATERTSFGGVEIGRTRFGPNIDLGVAFMGNTLLVGMPAEALEGAISTARGDARSVTDDAGYRAARAAMPERVTQLGYTDLPRQLQGLSDLTRLVSQPLAFAALAGLGELGGQTQNPPSFVDLLHLTDLLPDTLEVLAQHAGEQSGYTFIDGNRQRSVSRLGLR